MRRHRELYKGTESHTKIQRAIRRHRELYAGTESDTYMEVPRSGNLMVKIILGVWWGIEGKAQVIMKRVCSSLHIMYVFRPTNSSDSSIPLRTVNVNFPNSHMPLQKNNTNATGERFPPHHRQQSASDFPFLFQRKTKKKKKKDQNPSNTKYMTVPVKPQKPPAS